MRQEKRKTEQIFTREIRLPRELALMLDNLASKKSHAQAYK